MKHDDGIEVFLKLSGVETGPAQIPELLDPFSDSDGIDWTKCHVLVQGQHIDIIVKFTQGSKFFTGKAVTAVIVFGAGQPLSDQEPVRKFWPASARTRRESHILEGYQWVSSQAITFDKVELNSETPNEYTANPSTITVFLRRGNVNCVDGVQYSATHQDEEVDPSTFKHLNKNNGSNNGSVYAFEFCLRDLRGMRFQAKDLRTTVVPREGESFDEAVQRRFEVQRFSELEDNLEPGEDRQPQLGVLAERAEPTVSLNSAEVEAAISSRHLIAANKVLGNKNSNSQLDSAQTLQGQKRRRDPTVEEDEDDDEPLIVRQSKRRLEEGKAPDIEVMSNAFPTSAQRRHRRWQNGSIREVEREDTANRLPSPSLVSANLSARSGSRSTNDPSLSSAEDSKLSPDPGALHTAPSTLEANSEAGPEPLHLANNMSRPAVRTAHELAKEKAELACKLKLAALDRKKLDIDSAVVRMELKDELLTIEASQAS